MEGFRTSVAEKISFGGAKIGKISKLRKKFGEYFQNLYLCTRKITKNCNIMCAKKNYRFETLQLHVGQEQADPATDARAVPIYQTTSYVFHNSQHAADRFGLRDAGNIYGRLTNSTQGVFEDRVAALEGGVAGLAVASGAAAVTYALQNIVQAGDHIVAADNLYGGSYNLITHTLATQGITNTIVNVNDLAALEAAIQPNTKVVYAETFGNPNSDVLDLEGVAAIAHKYGIPLIVDNTFGTPYLIRPLEHGADIVVHSATKFLGGHGTSLGGVIVPTAANTSAGVRVDASGNLKLNAATAQYLGGIRLADTKTGLTVSAGEILRIDATLPLDIDANNKLIVNKAAGATSSGVVTVLSNTTQINAYSATAAAVPNAAGLVDYVSSAITGTDIVTLDGDGLYWSGTKLNAGATYPLVAAADAIGVHTAVAEHGTTLTSGALGVVYVRDAIRTEATISAGTLEANTVPNEMAVRKLVDNTSASIITEMDNRMYITYTAV